MIHNFQEDLEYSEKASAELFWKNIYQKAFPNLVNIMSCPGDYESQRMGIDRIILLSNGKTLKIDEKKRRENWDDILLEYISIDTTNTPGWIEKNLAIDYLAYAFMPLQKAYLLPWPMLKRVWLHFGKDWKKLGEDEKEGFRKVEAENNDYKTISVAVPITILLKEVKNAMIIQL